MPDPITWPISLAGDDAQPGNTRIKETITATVGTHPRIFFPLQSYPSDYTVSFFSFFQETFQKLQNVADGVDKLVNSPNVARILSSTAQGVENATTFFNDVNQQVKPLVNDMSETLEEIKKLANEARSDVGQMTESLAKTSDEAGTALKKAGNVFNNIDHMIGEGSPLAYTLTKTLKELEMTVLSLRVLVENLDQQPQSVVFGKKEKGRK